MHIDKNRFTPIPGAELGVSCHCQGIHKCYDIHIPQITAFSSHCYMDDKTEGPKCMHRSQQYLSGTLDSTQLEMEGYIHLYDVSCRACKCETPISDPKLERTRRFSEVLKGFIQSRADISSDGYFPRCTLGSNCTSMHPCM